MSKIAEAIQGAIAKQHSSGADTIYIKGTTLQSLEQELEQPEKTVFGMRIVVKPDNQMPDGVDLIIANKMSIYPPLEEL